MEERYVITPKGIAVLALMQCGLIDGYDDPRFEGFWTIFNAMMERHGYVEDYDNEDEWYDK